MADTKISALASGAPAQAGDEYVIARSGANYKLTLTNIAGNMPATTISSGNLTFSSTAQRITGDMSNATPANRLAFQSSTTNGNTQVNLIPNGTATDARLFAYTNSADLSNSSFAAFGVSTNEVRTTSGISGTGTYLPITFYNGGSERMRLDTSGNLGIGNTPAGKLDVGATSSAFTDSIIRASTTGISELRFADTTINAGYVAYDHTGDSMRFGTATTERMRIDSSGNVGIGTASPSTKLHVFNGAITTQQFGAASLVDFYCAEGTSASPTALTSSRQFGALRGFGYDGSSYIVASSIDMQAESAWSVGTTPSFLRFRTTATGGGITERMRITSDGEVYIAGTTDQGAYNLQCNGTGVWGAGAYVNGSDARLKDNIQSLDSGLDVVKAMRPVTFQYKPDYSKDQSVQPGFIAQELQTAMAGKPYLEGVVQEGPNHLNVAYQSIIPILVKAIQELEAKVAALEAK